MTGDYKKNIIPTGWYVMTINEKNLTTRKNIIDAAEDSFAKKGFDLTGIAEICDKAGLSKGAFYYHFKSKDDLIIYLLEKWLSMIDLQLKIATRDGKDIKTFFSSIMDISENVFIGSSDQLPVFLDLWLRSIREKELNKKTIEYYRKYIDLFERLVKKAKDEDVFRDIDEESVTKVIISMVIGMLMQGLLDPKGSDWEAIAEDSVEILFNGILKKE